MIAIAPRSKTADPDACSAAIFTDSILPLVRQQAVHFCRHQSAAASEEAVQECTALAWKYFVLLVNRGKRPHDFRYRFARFVVLAFYNGRRATGQLRSADVFSRSAQRRGEFAVVSFDHPGNAGSADADGSWHDAIAEDRRHGRVADLAAFRIDFADWLRTLTNRNRQVAEWLALGHGTLETARRFHITPGRVSQLRRELHRHWAEFQGEVGDAALQCLQQDISP